MRATAARQAGEPVRPHLRRKNMHPGGRQMWYNLYAIRDGDVIFVRAHRGAQ